MSKDPFEELFGRSGSDEPRTEPQPVPARQRLSQEQAERVRTSQLAADPSGGRKRGGPPPKAVPWIVVGVVAVLAIVASIIVVNLARGSAPDPSATPAPTTSSPTESTPPTTAAPDDAADADADDDDDADPDAVPEVEVGPTNPLDIIPWGATAELSQKFGMTQYSIPDSVNLQLSSPLIESLPESCAAMRTQWGATLNPDGTYAIRKPAERCDEAPALYDELWGLTDAFVQSIRPAG